MNRELTHKDMQKLNSLAGEKQKLPDKKPGDRPSLVFAIPTHSAQVSVQTLVSIFSSSDLATQMGYTVHLATRTTDALIERARNVMLAEFVRSGSDVMIFVDSDIGWDSKLFPQFLRHTVDLVGAAYPVRGDVDGEMFVIRTLDNELSRNPENGLMQVEAAGTGFLRITRSCALKMVEAFKEDWYTDPTYDGRIYNVFDCQIEDNRLYSEDYVFCRRWNAIGGKTWIDPEQILTHTGMKTWNGCLMRHLENHPDMKIPAHVPVGQGHLRHAQPSAVDTARALLTAAA